MSSQTTQSEPPPILGPNDPPVRFDREEAAYQKVKERLIRDHLGWIALVHQDEFIGVFRTASEAILEGFYRFGDVKIMVREIRASDEPDYYPHVDLNHPSMRQPT